MNWKYQLGTLFSKIINIIGTTTLTVGGVFLIIGVIGIFSRSNRWMRNVIVGVVLLWIGCWVSGITIDILGLINIRGPN